MITWIKKPVSFDSFGASLAIP